MKYWWSFSIQLHLLVILVTFNVFWSTSEAAERDVGNNDKTISRDDQVEASANPQMDSLVELGFPGIRRKRRESDGETETRGKSRRCGNRVKGCPTGSKCLRTCSSKCTNKRRPSHSEECTKINFSCSPYDNPTKCCQPKEVKGHSESQCSAGRSCQYCAKLDESCDPSTNKARAEICGVKGPKYVQCLEGASKWTSCKDDGDTCKSHEDCCAVVRLTPTISKGACDEVTNKCYSYRVPPGDNKCKDYYDCAVALGREGVGNCIDNECEACTRETFFTKADDQKYPCCKKTTFERNDEGDETIGKCNSND